MKCKLVGIQRTFDNGHGTHNTICFTLSRDYIEKNRFLDEAETLSSSVGAADPSGRPRTREQKLCRALAGVVSEHICSTAIRDYARHHQLDLSVYKKTHVSASDQIDLTVSRADVSFDVEVRSSGHFKKNLQEIYNKDFSILGWYVTFAKMAEKKKDFYITVLFPFLIDEIFEQIEIKASIAGGATKKMLDEIGVNRHLKQEGATYRVITPIAKASDGPEILSKIASADCDMAYWQGLENAYS